MRLSGFLYKSKRDAKESLPNSLNRLIRGCFLTQESAGIFTLLPLGLRVLRKIVHVIQEEMDAFGAMEIELPFLQSVDLWKKSGRYDVYGKEMLRLKDRNDHEFILPPTCEEAVFNTMTGISTSYKALPQIIYQITWKFRDELRPRSGLLRGRLFLMKDAYSFARDEIRAMEHYRVHFNAYCKIFQRLGMKVYAVKADSGEIGGDLSHEFVVVSEEGDSIAHLNKIGNEVKTLDEIKEQMGVFELSDRVEGINYQPERVMELGHIFYYDTKYSEKLNAKFVDDDNTMKYYYGGCYGIGVSRIMGMLSMERFWPMAVSPFQVYLVGITGKTTETEELYDFLKKKGIDVLYDDRSQVSFGEKMQDKDLIGIPISIIVGSNALEVYIEDNKKDLNELEEVYEIIQKVLSNNI